MALKVVVYINDRQIAEAIAVNKSGLAPISDYECYGGESASHFASASMKNFSIDGHNRQQSCRALVKKMAEALAAPPTSGEG